MKKILLCLLLLTSAPAAAHDLWMEREGAGLTLYCGHKHAEHAGAELLEYAPQIVVRADCYTIDGEQSAADVSTGYPVRISTACAVSCVLVSTGYWTKTPYGTKNVPKNNTAYPLRSWLSYESVKRIDRWSASLAKPLTRELDIVPLENPLTVKSGEKLRLLVTFDGKPVPGVTVSYRGTPRGVTGEDGTINIRLREGGFQVLQAAYSLPLESDEADEIVYAANLNFEIKDGP